MRKGVNRSFFGASRSLIIVSMSLFIAAVFYSWDFPTDHKPSSPPPLIDADTPFVSSESISLYTLKSTAAIISGESSFITKSSYVSAPRPALIAPPLSKSVSVENPFNVHDTCARSGASSAHNFFKSNALSFVGTSESKIWEIWGNAVKKGLLSSPTFVLDVGANVGQSGSRFLDIFPQAIVHSFEPGTSTMESLKSLNLSLPLTHSSRWRAHLNAVSSSEGELAFSSAETGDSQTATLGSSSRIGLKHNRIVKVTTVDSFLSSIATEVGVAPWVDLLKIDVEGWECDVLKGAAASLGSVPPRIGALYFEYGSTWFDERHGPAVPKDNPLVEITSDLDKMGYECYLSGVSDLLFIGPAISLDKNSILFGDISGYGPNVLCLHREAPFSKILFNEHPKSVELCKWW
jgi:FkbM family methyltransferase